MSLEIPVIKEIIIAPLSAKDERLAEIFDISVGNAGTIRREMLDFPEFKKGVQNCGKIVDIATFREYLSYRGTFEWKKEMDKIKKVKRRLL